MNGKHFYPIVVVQVDEESGGGFLAYAPDLEGCTSKGKTAEQAVYNAQQAVNEWLDKASECKQTVPIPGSAVTTAEQAKQNFLKLMQEQWQTIQQVERALQLARASVWL